MKNLLTVVASLVIIIIAVIIGINITSAKNSPEEPATEPAPTETRAAETVVPPQSVSIEPVMLTLGAGETYAPKALYDGSRTADGASYACDRTDVLKTDASTGQLNALKEGYAIVTMTSPNQLTAKSYVTVKKAPTKVAFPVGSVNMQVGEIATFTPAAVSGDEGFSAATLKSSDNSVVAVNDDGTVSAVKEGTANIIASTYNGASATVTVTVLNNTGFTEKTTVNPTILQAEAGWQFKTLAEVPAGSKVEQYSASEDGRWVKVKYNNQYGWLYNLAFGDATNYTEFTVENLPAMADDSLFTTGLDKRAIFDFVHEMSYDTNGDDTVENLCLQYYTRLRGSCYHHAALLCYLYNRCGYETIKVNGISALDGESSHSWCLSKTEDGWKHVDAQNFTIRTPDEQYFIDDYSQFFNWDRDACPAIEVQ